MNIVISKLRNRRPINSFRSRAGMRAARPVSVITAILFVMLTSGCAVIPFYNDSGSQNDGGGLNDSKGLSATFLEANKTYAAGRYRQARDAYKTVLKSVPSNVLVLHRLGNISYYLGQYRDARGYYQRALAEQSNQPLLYFNIAMVDLTTARVNLKHYLKLSGKDSAAIRELLVAIDDFADKSAAITKAEDKGRQPVTEDSIGIQNASP